MKIKELWIEDYKLLKNFNIVLDEQLIVMIGQNGSGKSTVLEFTSKIFYDLYEHFVFTKGSKPQYDFKLRYETSYEDSQYEVYITANKKTKEYYEVNIKKDNKNSKKYSKAQIAKTFNNGYKDILPQNIVMYYSGISDVLEKKFQQFQKENFIDKSLDGSINIEQPFFYFLPENISTILIGLLSYQYGDIPKILSEQFQINGFESIEIVLQKPYWASSDSTQYWGARGDLKVFLERLKESSNKAIFEEDKIEFTLVSQDELENLWSEYGEEKKLFEYLTTLQANGLITNIEIQVHKNNELISYNGLSEGEKQLLVILGLKELLSTENSLFLLDEPDTYLHPKWQKDFIKILIDQEDSSQFLITTHSPLILAHLRKNYLLIIKNGKIDESIHYSYGRDMNSILLDLMGVIKRPKEIEEKISTLFSAFELEKLEKAKIILSELTEYFGEEDNIIIEANTILSILED